MCAVRIHAKAYCVSSLSLCSSGKADIGHSLYEYSYWLKCRTRYKTKTYCHETSLEALQIKT